MNDEQFCLENFIEKYSQELETLKTNLEQIHLHPETFDALGVDFISPYMLEERIKDWLWLLSKLTHPLETQFFQPTWIPLEKYGYDIFTDLSNSNFPVFESKYKFYDPMYWYNVVLTKKISEVIFNQQFGDSQLKFMQRNRRIQLNKIINSPLFKFNENPEPITIKAKPKKRKKKIGEGNEGKGKLSL